MVYSIRNRWLAVWACIAATSVLAACGTEGTPRSTTPAQPAQPVPTQPAPKVTLEIDVETLDIKIVEPEGARACSFCTPELQSKYGPTCEKAPEAGIPVCAGLVKATVQELNSITLARSQKNPYCITIASSIVGGTQVITQLCLCQPTDPPGSCPAPAWIQ